jgi:flagellum-specific ATP synthase
MVFDGFGRNCGGAGGAARGRVSELARGLLQVSGLARGTALSDRVRSRGAMACGRRGAADVAGTDHVLPDGGADGLEIGDAVLLAGKS